MGAGSSGLDPVLPGGASPRRDAPVVGAKGDGEERTGTFVNKGLVFGRFDKGGCDESIFAACLLNVFARVVVAFWYFTALTRTFYVCFARIPDLKEEIN